ncbi:MAG: phosphodiester glycosidase family protein [Anaerolineae bacterium]
MGNVIGPDISFYQDDNSTLRGVDFEKMRAAGAGFVIIRAGQNTWIDPDLRYNWNESKKAGLPRGSYWFYDSRADPLRQAELWVEALGNDLGELPLWLDLEESYNGPFWGWHNWYKLLERLKNLVGNKEIGIYTAYFYWHRNTRDSSVQPGNLEYFHQYPLWIANYNVNRPNVPRPWGENEWLFWQFTSSGDGFLYGAESKNIDLNYFNGDAAAFRQRFNLTENQTPPSPAPGVIYRVTARALNVREEPSTSSRVIGVLYYNEIVEGFNTNPDRTWIQIRAASGLVGWSSGVYLVALEPVNPPPLPQPGDSRNKYQVTAFALRVRQGPGITYQTVGLLSQGNIVEEIGQSTGDWLEVRRESDGLSGWVYKAYLLKLTPPAPPPPEGYPEYRVIVRSLNVRRGPSTSYPVIGNFSLDDIVFGVDILPDNSWIKAKRKHDDLTGWVYSEYLASLATPPRPPSLNKNLYRGLVYRLEARTSPRNLVVHVLTVDLRTANVQFLVTSPRQEGQPLCTQTTSSFLQQNGLHVAINGDGFSYLASSSYPPHQYCPYGGEPVIPNGYAASRRKIYSEGNRTQPILFINQNNVLSFNTPRGAIYNAISGDRMLVQEGKPVSQLPVSTKAPRTAVGIGQNGRTVIMMVVDGHQPGYSEGVTLAELANLMIEFGSREAMNLDGGSSSTMVIRRPDGKSRVVNSPIDRLIPGRERPVANHLGMWIR